jgi:hypothetical protein
LPPGLLAGSAGLPGLVLPAEVQVPVQGLLLAAV